MPLFPGILAPVLAEVLYDRGGPAAPLLVLGPCMIVAAIAAGESRRPARYGAERRAAKKNANGDGRVGSCLASGTKSPGC